MEFKKDGKVYANMVVAVYDYCNGLKYCYGCKLYGKTGDCLAYAQLRPKEVARLLGYEVIEDKPDTEKGVIMNNERKMSILLNTIEQMACDAEDKGEIDFGLRLTVEDAYALCHAASHTDNTPDIREEAEELRQETDDVEEALNILWERVRYNMQAHPRFATKIKERAIAAACEAIQVAAMARKYLDMLEREDE